jgi:hypothetical protein
VADSDHRTRGGGAPRADEDPHSACLVDFLFMCLSYSGHSGYKNRALLLTPLKAARVNI